MDAIRHYLRDQDGMVARRQLHEAGLPPHVLERLLRQRVLSPLHPGVYVDHTGTPTYRQRTWGAVLLYEPAAATGGTAVWLTDGLGSPPADVQIVVPRDRRLRPPDGVTVTRSDALYAEVQWHAMPPRVRYEAAVVQLAAEARDPLAAVGALTQALGTRRTTPDRLAAALAGRPRVRSRTWLSSVLDDMRLGTQSVLEHGYLNRVERPHGLPQARWQVRESVAGRTVYRDATMDLPGGNLVVELDGRAHHEGPGERQRDYERDLEVAADGRLTVRLGWSQVFATECRTAGHLARIASTLGWTGTTVPCGSECTAVRCL